MNWKPHITVAAVIEQEGRFLLVQERDDGRLVYNQPAGHLEPNETLLQAVVRETHEETGWLFTPEALLGVYQWTHPDGEHAFVRFCFYGIAHPDPAQPALDPDILGTVWWDQDQLQQHRDALRSPLVARAIEDYLAGHLYPLQVVKTLDPQDP